MTTLTDILGEAHEVTDEQASLHASLLNELVEARTLVEQAKCQIGYSEVLDAERYVATVVYKMDVLERQMGFPDLSDQEIGDGPLDEEIH